MATIGKIARRSFLIGSAALVGGVAFGVYKIRKDAPNPLVAQEGEATLNPYILINAEGITIIAPRAEMGQGVHTTLAALVAEEMDANWDEVRVMHGPPAQAYYNGALLGMALPFNHYADGDFLHGLRANVGQVGKLLNLQVTGGSTSMKDAYVRMREAGATARETLKKAAALQLGVNASELTTKDGVITSVDGRALRYQDVAEAAAKLKPVSAALRDPSEWTLLGKSLPRKDMVGKCTGTAAFAGDVQMDGMLFASVKMNPKRSGMVSFDGTAAATMDGVKMIVDLGDGVGVIATNTWLAFQALDAIDVVWENSNYPNNTSALRNEINASFATKANSTARDDGDVDSAVSGIEIEARYHVPWLAHATMEPMNATAIMESGELTVWSGNQAPILVRDKCAEAVGIAPENVTLHTPLLGGGFGRRGEADFSVHAAKLAAAMPGTPIRMSWTREEDMRHDYYRPAASARFRGVVNDGKAVLLDGAIAAPSVTRAAGLRLSGQEAPGADRGHVEGACDQPYAIPHFRISGHLTDINVPIGFWRSVGNSFNGFFFDTFIDEMAHAAGADPLQFRIDMAAQEHAPSAEALRTVGKMANWTGTTPDGVGRGVGFTHSFGTACAQIVEVVDENGTIRINKVWIAADVGIALDPNIIESQLISGAIYGLSAAVDGDIQFEDGEVQQWNFPDYNPLRMHNTPAFDVIVLENETHMGGVGEPGTPPSMPALGNAIFDLTGARARELPLRYQFDMLI